MRFIICILAILLTSCASTVKNITEDQLQPLPQGSGYVLIPIIKNTIIHQLRINGPKYFKFERGDLKSNRKYQLVQLPAGKYSYSEIRLNKYTIVSNFDDADWSFTVQEGVINYAGHLIIHNHSKVWDAYNLSYEIQNNSSIALEYLEQQFPKLLTSHQVVYGGPGEDDFFDFVSSLVKAGVK